MADTQEEVVWTGSPSQVVNFGTFMASVVAVVVIVVVASYWTGYVLWGLAAVGVWACYKWLATRCTRIELTTERLRVMTGILARRTDELELYRVKDTSLFEPLVMRMVGAGNVILDTSDKSTPQVTLLAIPGAVDLRESLRNCIEAVRKKRGVRELDVD